MIVQKAFFVEETSQLITAGVSGCYLVQIEIEYKYDLKQAILLDPKGHSISVRIGKCVPNGNWAMVDE